VLLDEPD